ncbi:DUF3870 domain-containing protein [Microbacterium soli]|uniref:DUF3870 domain-containing protein n=1 Tax=Microbacterium soli TaxID=446075 RepID=A0ABP7MUN5_9MICO
MPRTVVVTGYAKMPTGTMIRATTGNLGMGAVVDRETHIVTEGWASLYAPQNQRFVAELLTGQNLMSDDGEFIARVQRDYWGAAQGAICQCYRDLVRRYREHIAAEEGGVAESGDNTSNGRFD